MLPKISLCATRFDNYIVIKNIYSKVLQKLDKTPYRLFVVANNLTREELITEV